MILRGVIAAALLALAAGGAWAEDGHGFGVSREEAAAVMREMRGSPVELERPVVVAAGFADTGVLAGGTARRVRLAAGDERVFDVDFMTTRTLEASAAKLIAEVEARFPSHDPDHTVEVDVIGISMGGLVARQAAMEGPGRRLRIKRLFTLATPHRGADLAWMAPWDARARSMRAGSDALAALDEALESASYELICYTRLGDEIVGEENTAPEGEELWWVDTPPFESAHVDLYRDPLVLADITRRLRGEEPLAQGEPPALPGSPSSGSAREGSEGEASR